ncbi:hypothetical protein AEST_25510 [Alishewanella aestuarii B11]|uniref:Uncharacterized protein n=1 Tax=Alishewanella aestuarii B11 TaxID=1197174 RepID=J1Q0R5_9ALTE|nr:hypothetical protein AEST_25510 [Alishewanella aestuarii B11]
MNLCLAETLCKTTIKMDLQLAVMDVENSLIPTFHLQSSTMLFGLVTTLQCFFARNK